MKGFAAAPAQREKVKAEPGCRFCRRTPVDPAHVVSRARGGCNDPECVIALCREHHRQYDEGWLDVLPLLSKAEQAHAVSHVGMVSALHQTTNVRWVAA
jgi:hypothetical protein